MTNFVTEITEQFLKLVLVNGVDVKDAYNRIFGHIQTYDELVSEIYDSLRAKPATTVSK
jgi:hypothetical protein